MTFGLGLFLRHIAFTNLQFYEHEAREGASILQTKRNACETQFVMQKFHDR
jgi:hypothetical protein